MPRLWVKAGACGQESTIEARRRDMTHVAVEFVTTCEHVQKLAEAMITLDIAHEMSAPLVETTIYPQATQYLCRKSCVVPAAILKILEVEADIFLPAPCQIEFIEGVLGPGEVPVVREQAAR